ncbi:uncharacterized protein LOC142586178 [Dermacentor variabilis]|uniref:uncharacterized protein LOC142586178 n=1 Tax=Dermacentor variabilis TaxID=34621 RepID=UPI003F5B9870
MPRAPPKNHTTRERHVRKVFSPLVTAEPPHLLLLISVNSLASLVAAAATSPAPSAATSPASPIEEPAPDTPEKELNTNVDAVCQTDMSKEDINKLVETVARLNLQLDAYQYALD